MSTSADTTSPELETEAVLVLAPRGRDAQLTCDLLEREGIGARICADLATLCARIDGSALAALVAEEALGEDADVHISAVLSRQPAWSDFPVIVFGAAGGGGPDIVEDGLRSIGNVTVLDRPVRVRSMIAAVRAAIRGRRRQFEARRAIESRDQFLAMLGHELRNPLSVIHLATDLLRTTNDPVARERQRSAIERQARHLGRLVDDLLDVARVAHGKVTLQRAETDLRDVLVSCVQAVEHAAAGGRLEVTLHAPSSLWVHGDRVRLEQVFGNLLTNAVKYTPRGGVVRVEAKREAGAAVVTVTDTGIGIEQRMLPRVFDLFAQADKSLDRTRGGLGLGLTLVHRLVQLHGGSVQAHSDGLGHGSEFRVRLPLTAVSAVQSPSSPPEPAVAPQRVVLVEDSEDIRSLLCGLLEIGGHEVWTAGDGPSGVERILEVRPHLALIDIGLPGFDGYEVARRVRSELGSDMLLVAITGYGQDEDKTRALAAGFDEHVTKPIGHQLLTGILSRSEAGLLRRAG